MSKNKKTSVGSILLEAEEEEEEKVEEIIKEESAPEEEVISAPAPFVKPEGHVVINGSVVPDPTVNGVNTLNMY